jgi:hypothetical protein
VTWCEDGAVKKQSCTATHETCGFDDEHGVYDCLE